MVKYLPSLELVFVHKYTYEECMFHIQNLHSFKGDHARRIISIIDSQNALIYFSISCSFQYYGIYYIDENILSMWYN